MYVCHKGGNVNKAKVAAAPWFSEDLSLTFRNCKSLSRADDLAGQRSLGFEARGRCYDHNFLRFFPIFGEKLAFFFNTNVMINFFQNLALFRVKNANFFAKFFGENILKIITSVPGICPRNKQN
jgi:hypothetical protein